MISLNFPQPQTIKILGTEKYWVFTESHGRMLETLCGNTAYIFGFDNLDIIESVTQQQKELSYLIHTNYTCDANDQLIKTLCTQGGFAGLAWAVSGTDGVECAIAMNDQYWRQKGQTRNKVVSFAPGYHGSTYLARAMRGAESMPNIIVTKSPQWKKIKHRELVEYHCFQILENQLRHDSNIGAVIMESIPWANGLQPWSRKWWVDIRKLCTELDINLIIDDVMGGAGKLGAVFSHTLYDIQPDIAVLGKSLTGGFSPLSCACASKEITDTINGTWEYGHTWQPNMAGVAAAITSLKLLDLDKVPVIEKRLAVIGAKLIELGYVKDIISAGLLCTFLFADDHYTSKDHLHQHGLTTNSLSNSVTGIVICAPIIADDEYFIELENRLTNALK